MKVPILERFCSLIELFYQLMPYKTKWYMNTNYPSWVRLIFMGYPKGLNTNDVVCQHSFYFMV